VLGYTSLYCDMRMYVCMLYVQVRGLLLRVLPDGTVGAANATSGALNTNCSSLGGYALVNVSTAEALRIATSALDAYKQSLQLQQDEVGGSETTAIGTLCLNARASLLLQSEHSGQVRDLILLLYKQSVLCEQSVS
jgi:hypothetical protein